MSGRDDGDEALMSTGWDDQGSRRMYGTARYSPSTPGPSQTTTGRGAPTLSEGATSATPRGAVGTTTGGTTPSPGDRPCSDGASGPVADPGASFFGTTTPACRLRAPTSTSDKQTIFLSSVRTLRQGKFTEQTQVSIGRFVVHFRRWVSPVCIPR